MLAVLARELAAAKVIKDFAASLVWQRRFLSRHKLAIRACTHQCQVSPPELDVAANKFALSVCAKIDELGVSIVYNTDQTGVAAFNSIVLLVVLFEILI